MSSSTMRSGSKTSKEESFGYIEEEKEPPKKRGRKPNKTQREEHDEREKGEREANRSGKTY